MSELNVFEQPIGRALFLGDIENLAWDRKKNTLLPHKIELISKAVNKIFNGYEVQEVIASSRFFAESVWFHWGRNVRRLFASGPDAADLELLRVMNSEDLSARFNTVFIGSGDGIFSESASDLVAKGVQVVVLTGTGTLSKKLKLSSSYSISLHNVFSHESMN